MQKVEEYVHQLFESTIEVKIATADSLSNVIAKAGHQLAQCLLQDGRLFICGNGASAANCMHFTSSMLNHYEVERPALPVINLSSAISSLSSLAGEHYNQVFARQIQALGQEGDMLVLLTINGNSDSMIHALHAADERGMNAIVLSGRDGGVLTNHLGPEDIEIRVPSDNAAIIYEVHLFILHCFCDLIDQILFGTNLEN